MTGFWKIKEHLERSSLPNTSTKELVVQKIWLNQKVKKKILALGFIYKSDAIGKPLLFLALFLFTPFVDAIDPAPLDFGGAQFLPQVEVIHRYDDNLLYQASGEISSFVTVVSPEVTMRAGESRKVWELAFDAELGRHWNSSADNYNDFGLSGGLDWELNARNALSVTLEFEDDHEARGTAFSAGNLGLEISEPDTFENLRFKGNYRFGVESAKGRLLFALENDSLEYTSRRDQTLERDRDSLGLMSTFLWRVGGRTDLLVEVRSRDIDYNFDRDSSDNGFGSLDSKGRSYFLGLTWEASSKTEGSLRLGRTEKDFDSGLRSDFSGLSWEFSAQWSPRSHSSIDLVTSRRPIETDGSGSFIDEEAWELKWRHGWSEQIESKLAFIHVDRVYKESVDAREEDSFSTVASIVYKLKRWLDVGIYVERTRKNANLDAFQYDRDAIGLNLKMSL